MLIPLGLCILLCLILLFMQFYVYLMAVTVELKLKYIIKNSFIFAVFPADDPDYCSSGFFDDWVHHSFQLLSLHHQIYRGTP